MTDRPQDDKTLMPDEIWVESYCDEQTDAVIYGKEVEGSVRYIRADLCTPTEPSADDRADIKTPDRECIMFLISMGFSHRIENGFHVVEGHGFKYSHIGILNIAHRIRQTFFDTRQPVQSGDIEGPIGYAVLGDIELETDFVTVKELDGKTPYEYYGHKRYVAVYTWPQRGRIAGKGA